MFIAAVDAWRTLRSEFPLRHSIHREQAMPAKRPSRRSSTERRSVATRVARLETQLATLTRTRVNVRRDEFVALSNALRSVEQNTRDLEVQFKRIAQIQADLDRIKNTWMKAKLPA